MKVIDLYPAIGCSLPNIHENYQRVYSQQQFNKDSSHLNLYVCVRKRVYLFKTQVFMLLQILMY